MSKSENLQKHCQNVFSDLVQVRLTPQDQVVLEVPKPQLLAILQTLRDHEYFQFEQLMDLCGVDYTDYGQTEWSTTESTTEGFSRGVEKKSGSTKGKFPARFAVVYQLLSITLNHRICLKVFVDGDPPILDSAIAIWASANWYEREAFDLLGILFEGHPDLRRILTDYNFEGHPLRKDFPLIGHVEMRYDAKQQRVVYEPVSIEPRTLVPKVIRPEYPV